MRGLAHVGLARYMDTIVGCDATTRHKPDPEPVRLALHRLGSTPDEAVFVGDSVHDCWRGTPPASEPSRRSGVPSSGRTSSLAAKCLARKHFRTPPLLASEPLSAYVRSRRRSIRAFAFKPSCAVAPSKSLQGRRVHGIYGCSGHHRSIRRITSVTAIRTSRERRPVIGVHSSGSTGSTSIGSSRSAPAWSATATRAEELTQDVFVRAWEKLHLFRGESSFATWLHRLTVNVVLNARKSRRPTTVAVRGERRRIGGMDALPGVVGMPLPPGDMLDLEEAITKLPPGARRVFVLHDVEGYKHEEIAEMLGVTSGATKAQLHRARLLLREALNR